MAREAAPAADLRSRATRPRSGRRVLAAAALVAVAGAGTFAVANAGRIEGWAVYHGHLGIAGRLAGHSVDLPAAAVRCANCHEPGVAPSAEAGSIAISPLTGRTLPVAIERRGGPASAYDRATFCRTLATGLDPSGVLLERTMPRFSLDVGTCDALWAYLSAR